MHVDGVLGFLRHSCLVGPWVLLVEAIDFMGFVLLLHKIAGAFHEQYAGDNHTYAHCGEQIDEHGGEEHDDENEGVIVRDMLQVAESAEVDDAPTHGYEDAGKH